MAAHNRLLYSLQPSCLHSSYEGHQVSWKLNMFPTIVGKLVTHVSSTMSRSGATQAKDRLYAQLASRLKNMSCAVSQTADLMEHLQNDLDAMRVLAGIHAAQFMTASAELQSDTAGEGDASGRSGSAE